MFRVGDLVRGTTAGDTQYARTGSRMTMGRVISVDKELQTMDIIILDHEEKDYIGSDYNVEMKYFELIDDVPYNNIVKILNAPYGSTGIINHIGTIISKDIAMNLINNYEYTSHGIENSTIYFIPHFFKYSKGPQVWGLGHNIKDIYYINVTNPNPKVKKMTIEEIEKELGYKIEIVDEEN